MINFRPLPLWTTSPRLYRSGDLSDLDREQAAALVVRTGLGTLVDLRSDEELAQAGPPLGLLSAGVSWVRCPITGYSSERIRGPYPTPVDYAAYYVTMFTGCTAEFVTAVRDVLTAPGGPVVFGCTAGKDRTGVLAAILLEAAGAPDAVICEDYARSSAELLGEMHRFERRRLKKGETEEEYRARLDAKPEAMREFLAWARRASGGLVPQLTARGLDPATFSSLLSAWRSL